jgi:hypothetical protein
MNAQSCLPEGITFATQSQIDSFSILYPNCSEIEGEVFIEGEDINSLIGIEALTAIHGSLRINYNNTILTTLNGLNNLTYIGGSLMIGGNAGLSDISALGNVDYVGYFIIVSFNPYLNSLAGLDNIVTDSLAFYDVFENHLLTHCEVISLCEYLDNPNGDYYIGENDEGCNSQWEVREACAVGINESLSIPKLSTYPNPFTTATTIEYELTEPSHVQLTIYNAIGEVVQVAEDRMMPHGKHSFIWTADRLPEGLYYTVMRSEEWVEVVKVVKQ